MITKSKREKYNPNLGFIGNTEVSVSNYLFTKKRSGEAYRHTKAVVKRILKEDVANHFEESKKLTKFLKLRDLTFSKKTKRGYQTFTVPCTTTVVPFEKSLFNEIEKASQQLIVSLRYVLQDIYGASSVASSAFVKSLPPSMKKIFIHAIEESPTYFPQLHHPNMKDYPFMDNVGLDLVLVEDYLQKATQFPTFLQEGKLEAIPQLPFKILEINAGSPSGASNNMNMLQGVYNQNPEILDSLGKVMPNDHFEVLGSTYKSLGENWTGITDGVQIVLPPGGSNGASPEIHQLAAYSGLIYADADQLYQDPQGYIRLRTVADNPIVTAIYSRVNTDSALFDTEKDLLLRDQETGERIYLKDVFRLGKDGKAPFLRDSQGRKVPLQSAYAIPGAVDAIVNKKLYMGGLNRILDNKIILATLTHYAPKFFSERLQTLGLADVRQKIVPPQTLPPTAKSVEVIKSNPDDWVVKAPSLAGGQGVFILKTLAPAKRAEVLAEIEQNPDEYAYQQLVKIGRIPVAVHRKNSGYKFANLAADLRMWVFFGGGENELPRLTHNALVRYAPHEKGAMSSIVNTSAGGGYAPFVIIDDTNHPDAIHPKDLVKALSPLCQQIPMPIFVAAGLVQIARILKKANSLLATDTKVQELLSVMIGLKVQLKEVLSFLDPSGIEHIYNIINILEAKVKKKDLSKYYQTVRANQLEIVCLLKKLEGKLLTSSTEALHSLKVLNFDRLNFSYEEADRKQDRKLLKSLSLKSRVPTQSHKDLRRLKRFIRSSIDLNSNDQEITDRTKKRVKSLLSKFCKSSKDRLEASPKTAEFGSLFSANPTVTDLRYETLFLGNRDEDRKIRVASQYEKRNKVLLCESEFIPPFIQEARQGWLAKERELNRLPPHERLTKTIRARQAHFKKFPFLQRYQDLINSSNISVKELLELLPIAPYAKFNIEQFAREKNLSVSEVFSEGLKKDRLSLLTDRQLAHRKLRGREYAGECFAKKHQSHGLYSESDIFIWLKKELDPFTLIYTAGHELVHYWQIFNSMKAEQRALQDGGLSLAKFINYYGNFLGANQRSVDSINFEMKSKREILYGYSDRYIDDFDTSIMTELREALAESDEKWNQTLAQYGSLFGIMMPNATGTKVKALQEVLPALENAKNISFAKELGLEIYRCEIKSALPTANEAQVKMHKKLLKKAIRSTKTDWEALRIIASHQYYGVGFYRNERESENLTLRPMPAAVSVATSYNQSQQ